MNKKILSLGFLSMALVLTACGGSQLYNESLTEIPSGYTQCADKSLVDSILEQSRVNLGRQYGCSGYTETSKSQLDTTPLYVGNTSDLADIAYNEYTEEEKIFSDNYLVSEHKESTTITQKGINFMNLASNFNVSDNYSRKSTYYLAATTDATAETGTQSLYVHKEAKYDYFKNGYVLKDTNEDVQNYCKVTEADTKFSLEFANNIAYLVGLDSAGLSGFYVKGNNNALYFESNVNRSSFKPDTIPGSENKITLLECSTRRIDFEKTDKGWKAVKCVNSATIAVLSNIEGKAYSNGEIILSSQEIINVNYDQVAAYSGEKYNYVPKPTFALQGFSADEVVQTLELDYDSSDSYRRLNQDDYLYYEMETTLPENYTYSIVNSGLTEPKLDQIGWNELNKNMNAFNMVKSAGTTKLSNRFAVKFTDTYKIVLVVNPTDGKVVDLQIYLASL